MPKAGNNPYKVTNIYYCPALINIYKSQKDNTMKVTKVDENHKNHRVGVSVSHTLNEEEIELVTTLRQANTKPSQIKRVLSEQFQKNIPAQKLKNLLQKLDAPDEDREKFENFLDRVVDEGGDIEYKTGTDEAQYFSQHRQ